LGRVLIFGRTGFEFHEDVGLKLILKEQIEPADTVEGLLTTL
jgi:hypothetical protein